MDIKLILKKISGRIAKYRYVGVILIAGILLMVLPTGKKESSEVVQTTPKEQNTLSHITSEELGALLSQIKGVGKVELLLTYAGGERTIFQTNEHSVTSENSVTREYETVLITNGNRGEEALITEVRPPEYLGAVVVCQGADDPSVKLAVSEAVSKATGLGTDRISVLLMK